MKHKKIITITKVSGAPLRQYRDRRLDVAKRVAEIVGGSVYIDPERELAAVRVPKRTIGVQAVEFNADHTVRVTVTCEASVTLLSEITQCFDTRTNAPERVM